MTDTKQLKFAPDENGIDPDRIPKKRLNNGAEIPVVGMGTFGSDHVTPEQVAKAVVDAAGFGQRAFDCASVYSNEKEIGRALKAILDGGVPRKELFIT